MAHITIEAITTPAVIIRLFHGSEAGVLCENHSKLTAIPLHMI